MQPPPFLKNTLKDIHVESCLLLMSDLSVKLVADKKFKSEYTIIDHSTIIKEITGAKTIHGALFRAAMFEIIPRDKMIQAIPIEWRKFVK